MSASKSQDRQRRRVAVDRRDLVSANVPATEQPLGNFTQAAAPGAAIAGNDLPLVVMSHGGGGWYDGHADTARALASAGFVAAAVGHSGGLFRGAPGLCSSDPSFDRAAFRATFNAEVVRFFLTTLHLESH